MTREYKKALFIKNYKGIFDPEKAFDYQEEVSANKKRYEGATYNKADNKAMERRANEAAFNKHLRK